MKTLRLVLLAALVVLAVVAGTASAEERPTLSGTWAASPITERWAIGDWGEACGPRPAPRGAPGGSVVVTESGGELQFSGGGYPRTSGCFEMGGGIAVTSHSASPRFWRTRCGTPAGDVRKATVVTTLSATDTSISFDETGEYQFTFKDQNCTASVRRSRSYTLVRRAGDEAPPPASSAPPPPATTIAPDPPKRDEPGDRDAACVVTGEASRIEVRPSRKVLKPGESLALRVVVLDAAGCRVPLAPSFSSASDKVTVSPAGLVTVAKDAPEGETTVQATVSGRSAKVVVEVLSPERYEKLLSTGGLSAVEDQAAAVAIVATSGLGGRAAEAKDGGGTRRIVFLSIVGLVVVALVIAGVVLLRRQRPETEEVEEVVQGPARSTVVRRKRLVPKAPTQGLVCKTCGGTYPPGSVYCPKDGSRLDT